MTMVMKLMFTILTGTINEIKTGRTSSCIPLFNKAVVDIRLRPGPVLPSLLLPPGETV